MAKRKRNYNPNSVKAKSCYTIKEIADIYNVHIRTIQHWRIEGLKIIDGSPKPFLILGEDIRQFLKVKKLKHKRRLEINEFYCTKCRCPRKSLPDKLSYEITNKNLGKFFKHAIIRGTCEVCNKPLFRFSSDRIIEEMKKQEMLFMEHDKGLIGNTDSSLNTDIKEEVENVKCEYQE